MNFCARDHQYNASIVDKVSQLNKLIFMNLDAQSKNSLIDNKGYKNSNQKTVHQKWFQKPIKFSQKP